MGCVQSRRRRGTPRRTERKNAAKELNTLQDHCDKSQHEAAGAGLVKLQQQHEWELQSLRETLVATGNKEREDLIRAHREEIERMVQEVTNKVQSETSAELHTLCDNRVRCISDEHKNTIEELQQSWDEEKSSLTENFEAARASLQGRVDDLTAELQVFNKLKQRVEESVLKRDLQTNIQAHGSPGEFWEQELESLLFVIEMKSGRIQELNSKLHQMQSLVEKNLSLEDQVKMHIQQNEDLRVQIKNHHTYIEQLTGDLTSLQQSLAKEALRTQKLNLEKEQLQYRLANGDSTASAHLSSLAAHLSPS
ncbi:coiled-coil domain-containing protein 69 [Amia ocellicauda]|uniref:coiled-coil domain-containing protein 69 n=1 Tax=Amia ocellicauda TaxID=2972642 RepID=UPI00346413B4